MIRTAFRLTRLALDEQSHAHESQAFHQDQADWITVGAGRCISGDFIAHSSYRVAGKTAAIAAKTDRLPQEVQRDEIAV